MTGNIYPYGTQLPLYSVINPDTTADKVLDDQNPFSFYDFLRYSQQQLSPVQYNESYQKYLVEWSAYKNNTAYQLDNIIRDRYVELLKDISLNHLTNEEKRFISTADFNDPEDLDIIIPFYSKKLREVCNFYASKREKIKNRIEVVKQKGNKTSVENTAYEAVTEYLYITDDDGLQDNFPSIQIDDIINKATVEVEELYDVYSSYLDNDPKLTYGDYAVKTTLRQDEYTANTNDVEADMFLNFDAAVKRYILEHVSIYLAELYGNFTINYNIDAVNLDCKVNDKLYSFITQYKDEATEILNYKKQLTTKYIGSDFYYITTGSTTTSVTSGVLFSADSASKNLLNRHYPTTASVEETSNLLNARSIGLFFRPEKNGLLYFTAPHSRYTLNQEKLDPNTTYIFPDPNLYGNTTGLTNNVDENYPLKHIYDYQSDVQGADYFSAEGDIKTNPFNQNFYAYFSKNQLCNNIQTNLPGLSTNLASVCNKGKCVGWSIDVFGNQFGLFKSSAPKPLTDARSTTEVAATTTYEMYDGGIIKFQNGYPVPDPVHADFSLNAVPNIFASNYYYNALFDGGIGNVVQGIMVRPLLAKKVYDGLFYDLPPETQYTLVINNTNNTFSNGSLVINCGLFTDIEVYEGSFNFTYILSSIQYKDMDGGPIYGVEYIEFAHDTGKNLVITENLDGKTTIVADEVFDVDHSSIYVKNVTTGIVTHLSAALSSIVVKYDTNIQQELINQVNDFNVYNDIIYFSTPNYFVVDRIDFDGTNIVRKSFTNNYISINPIHTIANISLPFFFETKNYSLMCVISSLSSNLNECALMPTFYKNDGDSALISKIEINNFNINEFINPLPIKFTSISKPILTYNTRNDLYAVVASVFDNNNLSYTYQILFGYNDNQINIQGVKLVSMVKHGTVHTINWYGVDNYDMFDINQISFAESTIAVDVTQGVLTIC